MKYIRILFVLGVAGCASTGPKPPQLLAQVDTKGDQIFLEGPAWNAGKGLLFADIPGDRILQLMPDGVVKTWQSPSANTNGMVFDCKGRLVVAEDVGRRVVRYELDGSTSVLASAFQGLPLNSPNDLVVDRECGIYFTDPAYRNRSSKVQRDAEGEVIDGIYHLSVTGELKRVSEHLVDMPNGLALSPDDHFLYVADNDAFKEGGARKLWRFDRATDGGIDANSRRLMFDWESGGGPDGMVVDKTGKIYVAAGLNLPAPFQTVDKYKAGVYIFSPEGELLDTVLINADVVTNVTIGGPDKDILYITTNSAIWQAPLFQ